MFDKPAVREFIEVSRKRSFPPKFNILKAGDPPRSLYLILEGSVSVLTREGEREMVLAYLNPGEFFGEMCLFPAQATRTAIVRTRTPILVAELEYEAFREFVQRQPEIMFEVAGQLAARLRDTSRRLRDLAFLDVAGRLAHELLELCKKPGAVTTAKGTTIKISRQELARIVGCSREMAGRVLKKLEEDGIIASQGRSILIYELG
ncbi:cyclic nucleotide-binding domain-containing protein [Panacagrimonas sp.]|uniref:cyclic nucleotide-binding domain-containing protein n=1 Tax=Panacagrimonas sp. TaxID=2480088 RepID=UPI003B51ED5A